MLPPASTTTVAIAKAGIEDAVALAELHGLLFTPAWDAGSIRSLMEHSGSLALLASLGEKHQVGFVLGRVIADEAEILSIGVARDWHRRGIAGRLVAALARLAGEQGATRMYLEVAADNGPARQLYLAQGFSEVGRRAAYYDLPHGQKVDALIMARPLQR